MKQLKRFFFFFCRSFHFTIRMFLFLYFWKEEGLLDEMLLNYEIMIICVLNVI